MRSAAFHEGEQAFLLGYSNDLNPYSTTSDEGEEWDEGWTYAFDMNWREVESDERDRKLLNRRT